MPAARALEAHIEIESWLEAIADELYRIGLRVHETCNCGCGLSDHVMKVFLIFVWEYAQHALDSAAEVIWNQIFAAKLDEFVQTFYHFRPSDN